MLDNSQWLTLFFAAIMNTFFYDRSQSLGQLTSGVIRSLSSCLNQRFKTAGINLTAEQWAALVLLWNKDGRTQKEIARNLILEKSSVSRLLSGLERRGFITRVQESKDSRLKQVFLTDKGRRVRDESVRIARALLDDAQAGITEAELALCRDVLLRVYRNLAPR